MKELIHLLRQAPGRLACERFDITYEMGLIMEMEGVSNVGQCVVLSGFHQPERFIKTPHSNIRVR